MQALSAAHHSPNLTVEEVSSAAFKITLIMLVTAFSFQKVILTHSLPSWVLKLCLMSYLFPHNGVTFEYLFSQWLFQTKNITLWVKALHGAEVSERMWWKNIVLIQILPISCRIFFFFFTTSMGNKDLTSNQGSVLTDSIISFRRTCYGRFRDVQSPSLVLGFLKKTILCTCP